MGAQESMAFPMAGGGGGGFSWGSLFSNPLVLQMMASMGASLDPEGPAGAIGGVTNQWIRSQSQMKMMKKLLGGGAKITMDGDKTSITGGSSLLDDLSVDTDDPKGFSNYSKKMRSQRGAGVGAEPSGAINPFVSSQPDTPLADLAGLRGEDINQAMQLMLGQRDISRKSVADIYDAVYKMGTLRDRQRLTTAQVGEKTPSIKIPGTDIVLTRKEYVDWYKAASKDERTTAIKNWNEAQRGGYEGTFEDWMTTMAKLSKPEFNIGQTVAKTEAIADVKSKKFFTDPKGLAKTVDDRINSNEVQNRLFSLEPSEREQALSAEKSSIIASEITSAGGKIIDRRKEGSIRIWIVEWPGGTTSEVRYAF